MTAEEIIERILSTCNDVSRDQILESLDREKKKSGGFISDVTLLRMIAAEFGCETPDGEDLAHTLTAKDLVSGLNNISVIGRVVAVFSPKAFNGNRSGKFASVLIADKSGILRVVLWNDKAELTTPGMVQVGQIVRFSHGYTREDYGGRVELHIGEKCEVEQLNLSDAEARDYPTISKFTTGIGELADVQRSEKVNVTGKVKKLFSASTFERQDACLGKVMRFVLADDTGELPVVVWNEKVEELEKWVKMDDCLQIVNAKVKRARSEGVEIHVDAATYVERAAQTERFLKMADLKEGLNHVSIEGEVVTKPVIRTVKTSKGENVKLATFELKDETGRMWVSAWRQHVEAAGALEAGKRISIKNAYVKKGFGEQLEISTRDATSITVSC